MDSDLFGLALSTAFVVGAVLLAVRGLSALVGQPVDRFLLAACGVLVGGWLGYGVLYWTLTLLLGSECPPGIRGILTRGHWLGGGWC